MQLNASELRERIVPLFEENFQKFGELGAAVSVWQHGKSIVDLYGGFRDAGRAVPWSDDTLLLIWSATKGLGSASNSASRSSGRSLRKPGKKRSRWRNCFRIKPGFARSIDKLMSSTTRP